MHSDARALVERSDRLFSAKRSYDSLNQEIARHFYPERATFTSSQDVGSEWADHLMTSYPVMLHRDLGNSFGTMLRPKGQRWFHVKTRRSEGDEEHAARAWLERATETQYRAMYDRASLFSRATKEADHDFAAFGGAVISTEVNRRDQALLYRCWHLRDVAWRESSYGDIAEVYRVWEPTAAELCEYFPKTVHESVRRLKKDNPQAKVKVRHAVIRADEYASDRKDIKQPWVSVFIDCEHDSILEEVGSWTRIYTIPRWATVSGSQYPYSPAAMVALPDARLIQAMTLTLLEAGERATNPPMIGVAEAVRGDLNLFAGGFTAVDAEYDERLGEVLRPLTQDKSGLPLGFDMAERLQAGLRDAFFLNTLSMPPVGGPEMTAYEVGQRVQEYIRNALPIFEPIEAEYNASLCEITFETLMRVGAFGPASEIPEAIRGEEVDFRFESPLAQMIERQKGQKFLETKAILADAAAIDPSVVQIMDFGAALRDVMSGIGAPAKWLRSQSEIEAAKVAQEQQQQSQQLLSGMQQGADVAETLGRAAQAFDGVAR